MAYEKTDVLVVNEQGEEDFVYGFNWEESSSLREIRGKKVVGFIPPNQKDSEVINSEEKMILMVEGGDFWMVV